MDTKDQNTRTPEERLADTIQPLIPYMAHLLLGPTFGRLFAHIYGERPTPRMVNIWRGLQDTFEIRSLLIFLSPTCRRWVRNNIKTWLRLYFEENDLPRLLKKMLYETWDAIRELVKDIEPDFPPAGDLDKRLEAENFSRVPKYSQIEAQVERKAEETITNFKEWAEVFPPVDPIVDPRLRRKLLEEVNGSDRYAWEVATTVAEAQINPRSLAGQLTDRQAASLLSNLSHLSTKELKKAEPSQVLHVVSEIIVELVKIEIDEQKAREFSGRIIGKVLINRHLDHPYSKKKKISLDKAIGDGLTLGDTMPCERAAEQFSLLENLIFLRQYLPSHLPTAEWEASDLFLRADERGISAKKLCEEENKKYETTQRNFERAIKRLKSQSTKP